MPVQGLAPFLQQPVSQELHQQIRGRAGCTQCSVVSHVRQDKKNPTCSEIPRQTFLHLATCTQSLHCKLTVFVKISIWNALRWSDAVSVIDPTTDHLCDFSFWKMNQTGQYFPCWEPRSHLSCALGVSSASVIPDKQQALGWEVNLEAERRSGPSTLAPNFGHGDPNPAGPVASNALGLTQSSHSHKAKPHEVCT